MKKYSEIKITCKKCKKDSYIQVISNKHKLYPKYCPKCSYEFNFLQKLKNHSMWILLGTHDKIMNHFLIQNQKNNHNFR